MSQRNKHCTKCGESKPAQEFWLDARHLDGLQTWCRDCQRQWGLANRDRQREASRRYREAHPEHSRRLNAERKRRARALNPEKHRQYLAAWYEAKGETQAEWMRRHRARIRASVFDHYGQSCACCGSTARLGIDHVYGDGARHRQGLFKDPRRAGGTPFYRWLIANGFPPGFQTLCASCNRSKGEEPRCRLNHERPAP